MANPKRKELPAEVCGYRSVCILQRDHVRETLEYRWYSVPNADYGEEDFEMIASDGWDPPCPF